MRYRSYLKWINLCLFLLLVVACKKWPYTMKTGYYTVEDIRVYANGSRDTLNYIAVGPGVDDSSIGFSTKKDDAYVAHIFDFDYYQSSSIHGDGGPNNSWFFKIVDIGRSDTHLYCYRESTYPDTISGVFDNYITFTYIE